MVFSSGIFLYLFLPTFLLLYVLAPQRVRLTVLLIGSYVFYGWWRVDLLALLAAVTLWTWVWGWIVVGTEGGWRRVTLGIGVAGDLGVLAWFKYHDFTVENVDAMLVGIGLEPTGLGRVLLPIGISFYVFQAISYLVDLHRGDAPAERSLLTFATFIAMFPQLIAGPVLRYKDLAPQLHRRVHSFERFSEGARRFMLGFSMKVLVADVAAPLAEVVFDADRPTMIEAWLGTLAYTIQIFFDFAGYSHMAIGLGLMMGFRFMENFDQPYISGSITEFWRRWHISLSTWLRDYLYIPLGGNRRGTVRTYVNLGVTMLLGGLWHGAAWTFVVWGAWHGALLAIERHRRERLTPGGPAHPYAMARTMLWVMIGWVVFRAPDLGSAADMLAGMAGLHGVAIRDTIRWQLTTTSMAATLLGLVLVYCRPLLEDRLARSQAFLARTAPAGQLAVTASFVLALVRLGALRESPFLYFQF